MSQTPEPWVETRPGGVFFICTLLITPVAVALVPWLLSWVLRASGVIAGPSRLLDPVPAVAAYMAPVLGWLALPALLFTLHALRIADRLWARRVLWVFAALHVGTLVYTVGRWVN